MTYGAHKRAYADVVDDVFDYFLYDVFDDDFDDVFDDDNDKEVR